MESPKTLQEAIQLFSDFENCRQFMVASLAGWHRSLPTLRL